MSVLLDTDFLVAYWNPDEKRHDEADTLFDALARGERGRLFVTDFVVDEAATLALRRARNPGQVRSFLRFLLGIPPAPRALALLHVSPDLFFRASERFLRMTARGLSFTDCASLEVLREFRLDAIASFDAGFRGLASVLP